MGAKQMEDKETDKYESRQIEKQTERQTKNQTNRQTDKLQLFGIYIYLLYIERERNKFCVWCGSNGILVVPVSLQGC